MDKKEVRERFEAFCKKWDIDCWDYSNQAYTLNALEQAYSSGYYYGEEDFQKRTKKEK